jgi:hypothetical protein
MPTAKTGKLSDLTPDPDNANKGTQRGLRMLDNSLRNYGAGRSIVTDKNDVIIGGNKTAERAADIGLNDTITVETDGTQLVVVKRTDLDLATDPRARELAYADNRVGQVDLDWDVSVVMEDIAAGVKLDGFDFDGILGTPVDYNELWKGMPEFEQENKEGIIIRVHFENQETEKEFFDRIGQKFTDKTNSIWYPERPEELNNQLGTGMKYTE